MAVVKRLRETITETGLVHTEANIPMSIGYFAEPYGNTSWTHEIPVDSPVFFKKPDYAFQYGANRALPRLVHMVGIPIVNLLMYNAQMQHYTEAMNYGRNLSLTDRASWMVSSVLDEWKLLGVMMTPPLPKVDISNRLTNQRRVNVNWRGGNSRLSNIWGTSLPHGAYCFIVRRYCEVDNGRIATPSFFVSETKGVTPISPPPGLAPELASCFPEWVAIWTFSRVLPMEARMYKGPDGKQYIGDYKCFGKCVHNPEYDRNTIDATRKFGEPRKLRSLREFSIYQPIELSLDII